MRAHPVQSLLIKEIECEHFGTQQHDNLKHRSFNTRVVFKLQISQDMYGVKIQVNQDKWGFISLVSVQTMWFPLTSSLLQ